jgi:hypothetical protein
VVFVSAIADFEKELVNKSLRGVVLSLVPVELGLLIFLLVWETLQLVV